MHSTYVFSCLVIYIYNVVFCVLIIMFVFVQFVYLCPSFVVTFGFLMLFRFCGCVACSVYCCMFVLVVCLYFFLLYRLWGGGVCCFLCLMYLFVLSCVSCLVVYVCVCVCVFCWCGVFLSQVFVVFDYFCLFVVFQYVVSLVCCVFLFLLCLLFVFVRTQLSFAMCSLMISVLVLIFVLCFLLFCFILC